LGELFGVVVDGPSLEDDPSVAQEQMRALNPEAEALPEQRLGAGQVQARG
jgi:hypothetical protein